MCFFKQFVLQIHKITIMIAMIARRETAAARLNREWKLDLRRVRWKQKQGIKRNCISMPGVKAKSEFSEEFFSPTKKNCFFIKGKLFYITGKSKLFIETNLFQCIFIRSKLQLIHTLPKQQKGFELCRICQKLQSHDAEQHCGFLSAPQIQIVIRIQKWISKADC